MTLLIDADDTLWENIRVFNQINSEFASWVGPNRQAAVLAELDEIQQSFVKEHGYGAKTFMLSLREGFRQFSGRELADADQHRIDSLVEPLQWKTLDLLEGVGETLTELGQRHDLVLFTKGDEPEQQRKVDCSGLRHHFSSVVVVADKHTEVYRSYVDQAGLAPADTWMIGNSLRSDVNPALAAGLGAVYIEHPDTWGHEHGTLDESHPRLLQVESFTQLPDHF